MEFWGRSAFSTWKQKYRGIPTDRATDLFSLLRIRQVLSQQRHDAIHEELNLSTKGLALHSNVPCSYRCKGLRVSVVAASEAQLGQRLRGKLRRLWAGSWTRRKRT